MAEALQFGDSVGSDVSRDQSFIFSIRSITMIAHWHFILAK
jgi:hypothetical protein